MNDQGLVNSHSRASTIFLAVLLFLILAFMLVGGNAKNPKLAAAGFVYLVFLLVLFVLMMRTGKISRYRSIFFSVYAIAFVLTFIPMLLESRGHIALTSEDIANLDTPLCHLTIPMLIFPGVVYGVLIFPTRLFSSMGFFPMLFLWLGATIVLGKGWCSWGCFYGGLDEFFSKLLPKRILSSKKFNYIWRWFPYALLFIIIVWAFVALEPVYCTWLCPFKAVTEFVKPVNWLVWLQTAVFIVLFAGLVVALPLLMKRRVQCGLFCPFGAFQAMVGLINPYRVRIHQGECSECRKCVDECPTFSIVRDEIGKPKVTISCTRCGHCMEVCSKGSIQYALVGVPLRAVSQAPAKSQRFLSEIFRPDTLFVFGAIMFGGIMSGGMVAGSLLRILHFIQTGSFLM